MSASSQQQQKNKIINYLKGDIKYTHKRFDHIIAIFDEEDIKLPAKYGQMVEDIANGIALMEASLNFWEGIPNTVTIDNDTIKSVNKSCKTIDKLVNENITKIQDWLHESFNNYFNEA